MIFITLGSQKFQFNRLLKEVDTLIETGYIKSEVIAQIGYSDYKPKNFEFFKFLDRQIFNRYISESDLVISHGGTGSIISALKCRKPVIAVPRLKIHGEHVDDHQLQIVTLFEQKGYILSCKDIKDLNKYINYGYDCKLEVFTSTTSNIISSIDDFIHDHS